MDVDESDDSQEQGLSEDSYKQVDLQKDPISTADPQPSGGLSDGPDDQEDLKEGSDEATLSNAQSVDMAPAQEEQESIPLVPDHSHPTTVVETVVNDKSSQDYFSWCWSLKLGQSGFAAAVNQLFSSHAVTKLVSETLLDWGQGQAALAQRLRTASLQYSNTLVQPTTGYISWPQSEGKAREVLSTKTCLDDRDSCKAISDCLAVEATSLGNFGRLLDHLGTAIRIVK